ncbi:plastocyanin/azurin family copper-binding protein [Salinibacter sp. 10B]|uniref:plastocyanin/azurin family copper-binding protein n=1 Tax=Salinibacter sp. 10B TaxID=1923971 RepID=UPI001C6156B5|nr:plastocyanin/azurin family copper-binding protein [Salinibacter sp. 10B]
MHVLSSAVIAAVSEWGRCRFGSAVLVLVMLAGLGPVQAQEGGGAAGEVAESDYYRLQSLPVPEGVRLEVGGMAQLPDGRLAVATRRGDVWMIENPTMAGGDAPEYHRFAQGLHEPLGLAYTDGALIANQRGELTRMVDTDGDERADRYENITTWALAGNYHEYSYGPEVLPNGDLFVTLNLAWIGRGSSLKPWSGWGLRVSPDGEVTPLAAGMRSPAGFGRNADGDLFYSENQGDWVGTGRITHVEKGDFVGHPSSLKWADRPMSPVDLAPEEIPDSGAPMHEVAEQVPGLKLPAVWFPQGIMGISTSDILVDTTGGAFGPFSNHLFVGDQGQSKVMRVFLEQVKGNYQGVVFPFRSGFHSGVLQLSWGRDGSLFAGMTNRGWPSTGSEPYGIDRLVWTGRVPFEMKTVEARTDGFEITFTRPVDRETAADPSNYEISGFTYHYHSDYGSEVINRRRASVARVQVAEDGRSVRLAVDSLRPGYIHEIQLQNLTSASGVPLLHTKGYYTLNHIPEGTPLSTGTPSPRTPTVAGDTEAPTKEDTSSEARSSAEGDPSDAMSKHQTTRPDHWTGGADRTLTISTKPGLQFNKSELQVKAGERVKLVFRNTDDLMHNLLIVQSGAVEPVAKAAMNMGLDGQERGYVPRSDRVLFHTSLLQPETEEAIYFTAPETAGEYPYVCTFPGHWRTMQGVLHVGE